MVKNDVIIDNILHFYIIVVFYEYSVITYNIFFDLCSIII